MAQPAADDRLQLYGTNGLSRAYWHTNVATTGARVGFLVNDVHFRILNQQPTGALYLGTNNAVRMFMDNSGLVGLSNAAPFALTDRLHIHEATGGANNYLKFSNAATGTGAANGARIGQDAGGQNFRISQLQNADMEFWTNGSQCMTLDPNGNVGINTIAPTANLHVDGQVRFENLITLFPPFPPLSQYVGINPATGDLYGQDGSLPQAGTAFGNTLYWDNVNNLWTDNGFLRVDPLTNFVGVGNITAPVGPLGGTNFHGPPAGTTPPLTWQASGGTPANPLFSVDGDVTISGNYYGTNIYISSDERIKKDVAKLPDWKKVLDIQPYSYKYIGQEHDGLSYGFLAQDVNRVLPELTSLWGNAGAVNYIGFIPFLTQGVQEHENRLNTIEQNQTVNSEANTKIETLENENEQLKSRLAALEERFNALCNLPCIQNNPAPNGNGGGTGNGFGQTGTLGEPPTLEQNLPNPFSETTVIRYFLPEGSVNAKIEVRNTENKVVGSFPVSQAGHGNITISAGTLAAGNYFYSLIISNNIVETKKMILLN